MYPARSPPTPGLGLGRITGTPMGTFLGAPNGPYLAWAPNGRFGNPSNSHVRSTSQAAVDAAGHEDGPDVVLRKP